MWQFNVMLSPVFLFPLVLQQCASVHTRLVVVVIYVRDMSWRVINHRLRGSRKKSKLFCFRSGDYVDSVWIVIVLDLQIVMQFLCADLHPFPSSFFLSVPHCTVKPRCVLVTGFITSFTPLFTRSAVQNVFCRCLKNRKKKFQTFRFCLKAPPPRSFRLILCKTHKEKVVKLNCKILSNKKKEKFWLKRRFCVFSQLSAAVGHEGEKKGENKRVLGVRRHCNVISMFGTLKSLHFILTSLVSNMKHKVPRSSCIAFKDFCSEVLKFFLLSHRET